MATAAELGNALSSLCPNLHELRIVECTNMPKLIRFVRAFGSSPSTLQSLRFESLYGSSLALQNAIADRHSSLRSLTMLQCTMLHPTDVLDVSVLARLGSLEFLDLTKNMHHVGLQAVLSACTRIRTLSMYTIHGAVDSSSLETLHLHSLPLRDLNALRTGSALPKLKAVFVDTAYLYPDADWINRIADDILALNVTTSKLHLLSGAPDSDIPLRVLEPLAGTDMAARLLTLAVHGVDLSVLTSDGFPERVLPTFFPNLTG